MYSISDLSTETRLSVEEIRMILMDVRQDWETCTTVTAAEYDLIKQSAQAALPESQNTAITPVNPETMPLEQQEKLVNNAGQVLGFPLAIAVMQEIRMVEALQTTKNLALLNVIKTKRDEFNQEVSAFATADQQARTYALTNI